MLKQGISTARDLASTSGEWEIPGDQIRGNTLRVGVGNLPGMSEPSLSSITTYQLRVVLCGVSPLVRRRLLVASDTTIAELSWYWYDRGQNATKERRAELRRLAHRKIEAIENNARATIERQSLEVQTQLFASALTSDAAKSFLEAMSSIESLMQPLDINTLESSIDSNRLRHG